MIQIGLLGSQGRMGRWVTELLKFEFKDKAELSCGANEGDSLDALLKSDVVIDFSAPAGLLRLSEIALKSSDSIPAFVIGSTGWKIDERRKIEELAKKTHVLMSSNFSTGVLALLDILKSASPLLEKLGYTPVIVDTHHKHKKDAPSGTAVSIQRAIAPAGPGNVQTQSIRAGEIIGDHEVTFYGPGDHLTLGHFAQDRSIFARGAIDVALWLAKRREAKHAPQGLVGIDQYFQELKS